MQHTDTPADARLHALLDAGAAVGEIGMAARAAQASS
jgi:hypothetical protein